MNYGEGKRGKSVFMNTNSVYYGHFEKLLRFETELCTFILTEEIIKTIAGARDFVRSSAA
jgi:hypothetical protein